ncbi:unnamed protein product [Diamesa serratosioi]
MVLLSNSDFLVQVTILAQKVRNESAFTMTIKRYECKEKVTQGDGKSSIATKEHEEIPDNMCLIRMKAKSKKITTVVKATEVSKLMESYGKVLKTNMDGLKKVKRVKNKSSKVMQ